MVSTGMFRRVDTLGRVVLPVDLRRKLRWRQSSLIEVFSAPDNVICLKKYATMGADHELAQNFAESMSQASKCTVCVSDMDQIIAVAGAGDVKTSLLKKDISDELEKAIEGRKKVVTGRVPIIASDEPDYNAYSHTLINPIISKGDALGAVVLLSKDTDMDDSMALLANAAALFLSDALAM